MTAVSGNYCKVAAIIRETEVDHYLNPGWNPCKPHAEDAPRLSKYHAKVFGMTPQKPKTKQNTPSTSTIYAGTRQNLRSHASTPRISKLHAEDLRRDIHRFHPGPQQNKKGSILTRIHVSNCYLTLFNSKCMHAFVFG